MKRALVVVDYQNDFVTGSLGFGRAALLRPVIVDKIEKALACGTHVIFTMDTHGEDYLETAEGRGLPVKHCIKGSWGWELDESVLPYKEKAEKVIEKPTFGSVELGKFLAKQGYDEVELCGLVSSICVLSNAVIAKASLPEAHIIVDSKATDDANVAGKNAALVCLRSIMVDVL